MSHLSENLWGLLGEELCRPDLLAALLKLDQMAGLQAGLVGGGGGPADGGGGHQAGGGEGGHAGLALR